MTREPIVKPAAPTSRPVVAPPKSPDIPLSRDECRFITTLMPLVYASTLSDGAKLALQALSYTARSQHNFAEDACTGRLPKKRLSEQMGMGYARLYEILQELVEVELLLLYDRSGNFQLFDRQLLTDRHLLLLKPRAWANEALRAMAAERMLKDASVYDTRRPVRYRSKQKHDELRIAPIRAIEGPLIAGIPAIAKGRKLTVLKSRQAWGRGLKTRQSPTLTGTNLNPSKQQLQERRLPPPAAADVPTSMKAPERKSARAAVGEAQQAVSAAADKVERKKQRKLPAPERLAAAKAARQVPKGTPPKPFERWNNYDWYVHLQQWVSRADRPRIPLWCDEANATFGTQPTDPATRARLNSYGGCLKKLAVRIANRHFSGSLEGAARFVAHHLLRRWEDFAEGLGKQRDFAFNPLYLLAAPSAVDKFLTECGAAVVQPKLTGEQLDRLYEAGRFLKRYNREPDAAWDSDRIRLELSKEPS